MKTCCPRHMYWCGLILCFYVLCSLMSGFAWPLKKFSWALWPWKQSYFMFHYSTDRSYKLLFMGYDRNGNRVPLDVERFFTYKIAYGSKRYDAITRSDPTFERLARYVCRRIEETDGPTAVPNKISLIEATWPQGVGRRKLLEEAEREGIVTFRRVKLHQCSSQPRTIEPTPAAPPTAQ